MLRQQAFFTGRAHDGGVKDLAWFSAAGEELTESEWFDADVHTLGMYLDGQGIRNRGLRGERLVDESFLVLLHPGPDDAHVALPGMPWARSYDVVLDTAEVHRIGEPVMGMLPVCGRSLLLLRAHR